MKKLLSILLAIISIFTITSTAFTAYADDISEPPISEGETKEQEEPYFDVTMYLCATANSFTGHVWLYFVNNSDVPVTVGYVELQPGQEVSVGSLRNTRSDGGGTYYNGEAMMAAKDRKLDSLKEHTTSLKMKLTEEQLETVSEKIKSINSYDMIFFNCGVFATQVWNSVSNKKVTHLVFPIFTIVFMKLLGGHTGTVRMADPTEENGVGTFKQVKDGVVPADENSFSISCVNF